MNYPDHIYKEYEIVEKDIYGEKHYALVRVYRLLGFKFKRMLGVYDSTDGRRGWISSSGKRWYSNRSIVDAALKEAHTTAELLFEHEVTK